jgi:hypothetical protein
MIITTLFCFDGVWVSWLGTIGFGISFFVFLHVRIESLQDPLGYDSYTVFVVTWQISTSSYANRLAAQR